MFLVSSQLLTGSGEAILIDTQFDRCQCRPIDKKDLGQQQEADHAIYISHDDPDDYLVLEVP